MTGPRKKPALLERSIRAALAFGPVYVEDAKALNAACIACAALERPSIARQERLDHGDEERLKILARVESFAHR